MEKLRTESIDFPFQPCTSTKDHPEKPYIISFGCMEGEPDPNGFDWIHPNFYGCDINRFVPRDHDPVAVAVGLNNIYLYLLPLNKPEIQRLTHMTIEERKDEALYTVAWCFDEMDRRREHKIVCGGELGILYVLDGSTLKVERELIGHSMAINDVRSSPTNPSLVLSCSDDRTVRVFHIRDETCLLLFGGRAGHRGSIVSVDWAFDAKTIMSAGFDHKIMIWDLENWRVKEHMKKYLEEIRTRKSVESSKRKPESLERLHSGETLFDIEGRTHTINRPISIVQDLHFDVIDCVRCIKFNNTNYVLSKGAGRERNISLWRSGLLNPNGRHQPDEGISRSFVKIFKKKMANWQCYFSKIAIDPLKKWVAVTTSTGTLNLYDLENFENADAPCISYNLKSSQTHDVSFSSNGQIIFCVGDKGLAVRLDRVPKSNKKAPSDLWES